MKIENLIKLKFFVVLGCFSFLAFIGVQYASAYVYSVELSWQAPASGTVTGYKRFYGTSSGNYGAGVDVGNNTTCTVGTLANGVTYYFAVKAYNTYGESPFSNEAISYPKQSISGSAGIADVTITYHKTAAPTASSTTVSSTGGSYSVTGITPGSYLITPTKLGYSFSPPSLTRTVGPDRIDANFTATPLIYKISGTIKTAAGAALAGVDVSAGGKNAVTSAAGIYSLEGLAAGNYIVTPLLNGYTFAPVTQPVAITNSDVSAVNFTASTGVSYSISGLVTYAGKPVEGVKVTAGTAQALTLANGSYTLAGLTAGSYTLLPSKNGYTFSPLTQSVVVGPSASNKNFTAKLKGDINADGVVSNSDLTACKEHILSIKDYGTAADINGDGKVNALDVQEILNILNQ